MTRLIVLAVLALGVSPLASGADPEYTFTHFAGTNGGNGSEDGKGTSARFFSPVGIATDAAGNVYIADLNNGTVRKVSPDGSTTTLAGLAGVTGTANGVGAAASFNGPAGTAVDAAGNVYVADILNHAIRKITPAGVVTLFAGGGFGGALDGQGSKAKFLYPADVAVDGAGNVYVADGGNDTIRKITPDGTVTTLAGTAGSEGNVDGTGRVARFRSPQGVAVEGDGNVYVADSRNDSIRKITPAGVVTTIAGSGNPGRADGAGSAATFYRPSGIAVGDGGNLYVADTDNNMIRKITPGGVVTTIAGGVEFSNSGADDGTGRNARFASPFDVAADAAGNLYVADSNNHAVRKITPDAQVTTFAGKAAARGQVDGALSDARFSQIRDMTIDAAGNIFLIDNHVIRKISAAGTVTTVTGTEPTGLPDYVDGSASVAHLQDPRGLAVDAAGNLYFGEWQGFTIRKVTPNGTVTTFAGRRNTLGRTDGKTSEALFSRPTDVAIDSDGTMYVTEDCTIRKITTDGNVSTMVGKPIPPAIGCTENVDGPFATAKLNGPSNLAIDAAGNLYVTTIQTFGTTSVNSTTNTIRKITRAGEVITVAGDNAKRQAYRDARGMTASFYNIGGIAVDGSGNIYATEPQAGTIRKVSADGLVTTIGGIPGDPGTADGTGLDARFSGPSAIIVDPAGHLYIGEDGARIRTGRPALADRATIDAVVAVSGSSRQLDTAPQGATSWTWELIRQPSASHSSLSSQSIRNPTHTTDLSDLYEFRLTATDFASTSITTAFVLGADGTATSAGNNVTLHDSNATLTFPAVTSAGRTVIASIDLAFSEPLPDSKIPWLIYDVTTTASFTPPARFCVGLPDLKDATQLPHYSLFHKEGSAFVDRTSSRDLASKTICADTSSLGRFVLGAPLTRRRPASP
ncbi:MAG TPA: hypothetical protein VEZ11_09885 [Thermoanaerobaculia bacterium]|nr:hypothetical protein [Thermoanaerobaculia bacterium]